MSAAIYSAAKSAAIILAAIKLFKERQVKLMLKLLRKKRGQNTAEYAILIGVIVAAAIAMQIYIRRGMQGRIRDAVDYTLTADQNATGDDKDLNIFRTSQYEPYYTSTNFATEQSGTTTQAIEEGEYIKNITESQTRTGNQIYTNWAAYNEQQ